MSACYLRARIASALDARLLRSLKDQPKTHTVPPAGLSVAGILGLTAFWRE